ncbi:hypothetical protein EDB69_0485 [Vibrio crassostreae]|nr:hypothetical protein EDB64_1211 [Vibrio crassostreae]ROP14235.1 hypothetical protein EDB63_1244 [Vibrio crassostreae]RPE94531.1 hypothetical protein EDB68_0562 [Vibrio crassostreae]RPF05995.1 hypothetical protein EDB17_0454 [Vibrio crassostreae]RPF17270.1 hypothetical protein EDB69_0485 [Vibrio crassostreae]
MGLIVVGALVPNIKIESDKIGTPKRSIFNI